MGLFSSKELKHLRMENEVLKTKIEKVQGKAESMKHLDEIRKRLRMEVSLLNEERKTLLISLDALKSEENEKANEIADITRQIEQLNSLKERLQNQIMLLTSQSEELRGSSENYEKYVSVPEEPVVKNGEPGPYSFDHVSAKQDELDNDIKEAKEKYNTLNEEEEKLVKYREERLSEIGQLQGKEEEYIQVLSEIETKIKLGNEKVEALKDEELALINSLEKKQQEIASFEDQMKVIEEQYRESEKKLLTLKKDERSLLNKIDDLKYDEQSLNFRLKTLQEEESSKTNKIREIDCLLYEKDEVKSIIEQEQQALMEELNEKKKAVNEAQAEYEKVLVDFKARKKELFDTEQTLNIKAQRLSTINLELHDLEKKNSTLRTEFTELENARNNIYIEIQREKDIAEKFANQNKKIVELVPLLEKRKQEIEVSNTELEERFGKMFQKFNYELNEINRKRTVLEQIVLQKEKDVEEKDQLLFEKLAALEESERVLNSRQMEIEAFELRLKNLKEQKDVFGTNLSKLDEEAASRQSLNEEIKLETELLFKKKNALQQSLQELLALMNESYSRSKERNSKFETELNYYEEQLQSFRGKISESVKELEELRTSVTSLKIEEQESKAGVDKLKLLKRRLLEEIAKNQQVLQRYQRVREKLKMEPTGKSFDEIPPKGKTSMAAQSKPPQIYNS